MSRTYYLQFGSGLAASFTGLAPTFLLFSANGLTAVTPPGISEMPSGGGLYRFLYGATIPIVFTADGATTGLTSLDRYRSGVLDPSDLADEALGLGGPTLLGIGLTQVGIGNTVLGIGSTLLGVGNTVAGIGSTVLAVGSSLSYITNSLGSTASSFGATNIDPGTIYGYLKRIQENLEGAATYTKSSGVWDIYSRGSSTLLASKTLANNTTQATKS